MHLHDNIGIVSLIKVIHEPNDGGMSTMRHDVDFKRDFFGLGDLDPCRRMDSLLENEFNGDR